MPPNANQEPPNPIQMFNERSEFREQWAKVKKLFNVVLCTPS
jgi:hypothetical protein